MNDLDQRCIILFDGTCNVCTRSVQFVLQHDSREAFLFASLQGRFAKEMAQHFNFSVQECDSFVLIDEGRVYHRSTAALRVAKRLGGVRPIVYAFIIVPRIVRDAVYDYIARHRYSWFGKRDECWLPAPALRGRFLE